MSKVIKMWRADEKQQEPVLVECPNGLYPAKDVDGFTVFENTHFENKEHAWDKLLRESEAWVMHSGCEIPRIEKKLQEAQQDAAEAAKMYAAVRQKLGRERAELKSTKTQETPNE